MGYSLRQRGRTVSDIIFSKFPVSAGLAGIAVVVALLIGIPLGCISAYNRGKALDNFIIVLATCGIAIPSFISSVLLLYTFGSKLNILPTIGLNTASSYIMPVTVLAIYPTAYITRLMRSSLLDVMGRITYGLQRQRAFQVLGRYSSMRFVMRSFRLLLMWDRCLQDL